MSIAVQCGRCNGRFSAPDRALGHSAPCPKCGNQITIAPHSEFETAPVVCVSQAVVDAAINSTKAHSKVPLLGASVAAAALIVAAIAFFALQSGQQTKAIATADNVSNTSHYGSSDDATVAASNDVSQELVSANLSKSKAMAAAGLGYSLADFKAVFPVGDRWKLLSETMRDDGTISYQLLSTKLHHVMVIVSGKPNDLSGVSTVFFAMKGGSDGDLLVRMTILGIVIERFTDWTPEEAYEWFWRVVQRGEAIDEGCNVQKGREKMFMSAIGVEGGTMFIVGVQAELDSKSPTLQQWLASHPLPPPKSGKSHYHSSESVGKVSNAKFSFANFRHKQNGNIIGELTNDSGKTYQVATFKLSAYDSTGALIDTGTIMIANFKAKETRSFDSFIKDLPNYFSYKLDLENGF